MWFEVSWFLSSFIYVQLNLAFYLFDVKCSMERYPPWCLRLFLRFYTNEDIQ